MELPPKLENIKVLEAWEYYQSQHTYRLRQDLSSNSLFASFMVAKRESSPQQGPVGDMPGDEEGLSLP